MPFAAPCESFCQPDMQWARGGGRKHRQLPAPAAAPLRLGNLLRVFEPRQPKARKTGAVFLSWLLPLDSWSLLAPSPGSIPADGLRLAAAVGISSPACSGVPSWHFLPDRVPTLHQPSRSEHLASHKNAQTSTTWLLTLPWIVQAEEPGIASQNAWTQKQLNTPRARAAMPGMLQWAASQKRELLQQCGAR